MKEARPTDRTQEILDRLDDQWLIDIATTCSNHGVALSAEMQLRKRYPSRKAAKKIKQRRTK